MSRKDDRIADITERVDALAEVRLRALEKHIDSWGWGGVKKPDDETFRLLFEQKLAEHPPVPIQMPDGQTVVASPFLLALNFVEGGKAELRRYSKVVKNGTS